MEAVLGINGTRILFGALAGFVIGLGVFTFVYAEGASYLSSDSAACANCHVMQEQYDGWLKSSHRAVATCNDCHTPRPFLMKWGMKALNGARHSWAFTTGLFKEPIFASALNLRVTEDACLNCHAEMTAAMTHPSGGADKRFCLNCHRSVGHLH